MGVRDEGPGTALAARQKRALEWPSPRPIGFSSNCFPHETPGEFLAMLRGSGATVVDLRAGRGQPWEEIGLDAILATCGVAFLGTELVLGEDPLGSMAEPLLAMARERQLPVRVFASTALDEPACLLRAQRDLVRLSSAGIRQVLVEPHDKLPSLGSIERLLSSAPCGLVADNLGLERTGAAPDEIRHVVQAHASVFQVKGFRRAGERTVHAPLAETPAVLDRAIDLIRSAPGHLPVTVETRAGSVLEDIALIRRALS